MLPRDFSYLISEGASRSLSGGGIVKPDPLCGLCEIREKSEDKGDAGQCYLITKPSMGR